MPKQYATCLCCIDGEIQLPVNFWIAEHAAVDYVDMITQADIVQRLSQDESDIIDLLNQLHLSVEKHRSGTIFIAGHESCIHDRSSAEGQQGKVLQAVRRISEFTNGRCRVRGLWVNLALEVKELI